MIRLRVSTLEQFRRVCTTEYAPESELVDRIRRGQWAEGPTSAIMDAGTAWHSVLANTINRTQRMCAAKSVRGNVYWSESVAQDKADDIIRNQGDPVRVFPCSICKLWHIGKPTPWDDGAKHSSHGHTFDAEAVTAACDHIGQGVCEITGRMTMNGRYIVEVEGTADHIRGLTIQDHKTKFSTPDARDYEQSLQWRLYLMIHDCQRFQYNLFDAKEPTDEKHVVIKGVVPVSFWRYPGMERECISWLDRFLAWAESHNLIGFLNPSRRAA